MTAEPLPRSRAARETAEAALLHIVRHYGERPEFVVLGGLVPELLCAGSAFQHAGTTDVDVQVDLEIACGAANAARLERALRNAGFVPEGGRPWRWSTGGNSAAAVVKFELLADLRGTGFAARDVEVRELHARIDGVARAAEVNVSGLAGFLLAKAAAAFSRRQGQGLVRHRLRAPAQRCWRTVGRGRAGARSFHGRDRCGRNGTQRPAGQLRDPGCARASGLCPTDANRSPRPRSHDLGGGRRACGRGILSEPSASRRLTEPTKPALGHPFMNTAPVPLPAALERRCGLHRRSRTGLTSPTHTLRRPQPLTVIGRLTDRHA